MFLLLAVAVALRLFLEASKNPADAGESGLLLLPFAMPWIMGLPVHWLGLATGFACSLFNAPVVYCIVGGLRLQS